MSAARAVMVAIWFAGLTVPMAADTETGKGADDKRCRLTSPASVIQSGDRAVFARFIIPAHKPADRIRVEWLDPGGVVAQDTEYAELDARSGSCLLNRLSMAGFPASESPGTWTVQMVLNGRIKGRHRFRMEPSAASDAIVISSVVLQQVGQGQMQVELSGFGFQSGSVVHIARFTESGGWQYVVAELPFEQIAGRVSVRTGVLDPGEYIAVIKDSEGRLSRPKRFVISTGNGYEAPFAADEGWVVTQGPYGTFSHWNRSLHAWDIVPRSNGYVLAMRPGVAHTHDLGMRRTPDRRSFGNYITIDHGDGEYSHYAHLATGSFRVHEGQHVDQGQALARVGNSGYSFGSAGGFHLHTHVTRAPAIASQSIPFEFGGKQAASASRSAPAVHESVQVAQWWTDLVTVPRGTRTLIVRARRERAEEGIDLHLISPDGREYGPNGEELRISEPSAGTWRISVEGMRGGSQPIGFQLEQTLEKRKPRELNRASGLMRN